MSPSRRDGFTIVELLVVVGVIALLLGILLPAIGKSREQARRMVSASNLHQLGQAHATYAAEWNGRQLTLIKDTISAYGNSMGAAFGTYQSLNGGCDVPHDPGCHPGLILGWGETPGNYNSINGLVGYWMNIGNFCTVIPMNFKPNECGGGIFGSFRFPNCQQFHSYLSGRFYDPVFYAPKDRVVWSIVETCFEDPAEFSSRCQGFDPSHRPFLSSYCMSPAAMFNPSVLRNENDGGWQDPWHDPGSFRSPALGQARYPDLKTHMLEHHWLQNQHQECNPAFSGSIYDGCEPYYFNHGWESAPVTLFYDGHVESLGVPEAIAADNRLMEQSGAGTWNRSTPLGEDGYYSDVAWDWSTTSFHILTNDGILGRDRLGM